MAVNFQNRSGARWYRQHECFILMSGFEFIQRNCTCTVVGGQMHAPLKGFSKADAQLTAVYSIAMVDACHCFDLILTEASGLRLQCTMIAPASDSASAQHHGIPSVVQKLQENLSQFPAGKEAMTRLRICLEEIRAISGMQISAECSTMLKALL